MGEDHRALVQGHHAPTQLSLGRRQVHRQDATLTGVTQGEASGTRTDERHHHRFDVVASRDREGLVGDDDFTVDVRADHVA